MLGFNRDTLLDLYWRAHPRFQFFKNCPANALFLDVGAGEGSLAFWKEWHQPERTDIKMYGIDLFLPPEGGGAVLYERFDALNLDDSPLPYEDGFLDIVYSTHVLEHLHEPKKVIDEILRVLKPGGLCYLEVPNHNTLTVPTMEEYAQKGYRTTTTNFYDDHTHVRPYSCNELIEMLGEGVRILESGTIQMPYLAEILETWGREHEDQEVTTYAIWLKTEWSDYVCFRKIGE